MTHHGFVSETSEMDELSNDTTRWIYKRVSIEGLIKTINGSLASAFLKTSKFLHLCEWMRSLRSDVWLFPGTITDLIVNF